MRRRGWLKRALCALLAATALLALTGSTSTALNASSPALEVIAQNGFGDNNNSYAWSMDWFDGKLYVGTGRDVLCVEDITVQHFLPLISSYVTNPSPSVRCPANPYDLNLRAEIWQYTPKTRTWKRVYRSPTEQNPLAPTEQVASDIAYRGMVDYTDPWGRQALYAAGVSADEYLPPLLDSNPPRILRSYDGVHWEALNLPHIVVHYPGGNDPPMGFRTLVVFHNHLFVTATPDLTGDGSLFEIKQPWSNHPSLVQVSPPNIDVFEVATFDGDLYLGAGDAKSGYSVWRTSGYGHPFTPVVTGGGGRGHLVTSVVSMQVYRGGLYVGASGWYNRGTLPLSELIRIDPNGSWTLVVGAPRKLSNGETMYPTSGLGAGFDSVFNAHFWRMASSDGGLYVGTNSWSDVLKSDAGFAPWVTDVLAADTGYQMWVTCDGEDFTALTRDAFGAGEYNFGARTLQPGGPGETEDLYIGSANHAEGTMILDDRDPACASLIDRPHTLAPPSAMIADGTGKGTLLSWKPSPGAVRYEVLAASEVQLPLYLKPPPTLPDGFQMEGATPTLTEPEAPESVQVTLSLPGQLEPIASTTDPFFVDRSNSHRVFAVVAVNAAGQASDPSNIQIAPEPEPSPTFGSLRQALGSAWSASAAATGSGPSQLLDAAQVAWERGDRAAALRDVQQLAGTAHGHDEELAALASRLERRLQYANVVGEP